MLFAAGAAATKDDHASRETSMIPPTAMGSLLFIDLLPRTGLARSIAQMLKYRQ